MNKNLTKIVGLALGLSLAVGVGAGIATSNKQAKPVYAGNITYSLSIDANDFNTTSYAANNDEKTSIAYCTTDNSVSMEVKWTSNQVMKNGDNMQWQKNAGYIYNSTNLGTINSVTVTKSAGTFTTAYGTSEQPSSGSQGEGKGYFKTKVGNATGTASLIVINFTVSDTSSCTVTYNANGGTGTLNDENSYDPGDEVIVLDNTFTREGYTFDCWNTKNDGSGQSYDEGDAFDIDESLTLYAQWAVIKYNPTDEDNTITWDLSKATYETMENDSASWVSSKVSIILDKASATSWTKDYCPPSVAHTRFYTHSVMTISSESEYKIESVVFNATGDSYATVLANSTWTNATAEASTTTVTVTPTDKNSDIEVTIGGATRITSIAVEYAPNVESISLSGTYPTEFTQGAPFSCSGMVVTANYFDSTNKVVTESASWSGYNMANKGVQTVTVSYTEDGITRTETYDITVTASLVPFISPDENSVSGYTGQDYVLSFTYGNLNSTLNISSDNTSVATVGAPVCENGEGLVQINYIGAGSTTIKFKDGSTQLASISVNVTVSSVTITGLDASKSVLIGSTANLGSTITVDAVGNCCSDVTWESDNEAIATVDENGVVTGVAAGSANITVTSDDYPSATMTCAVTVTTQVVMQYTNTSTTTTMSDSENNAGLVGLDSGIFTVSANKGETNNLPGLNKAKDIRLYSLKSKDATGNGSYFVVSVRAGYIVTNISIDFKDREEDAKVYSGSNLVSKTAGTYAINNSSFKVQNGYKSDGSTNTQVQINSITINVAITKEVVQNTETLSNLRFDYAGVITDINSYSNTAIRFGGFISQNLWNVLDAEADIQGYGILVAANGDLDGQTIKQRYIAAKTNENTVEQAMASLSAYGVGRKIVHSSTPTSASADQKTYMGVSGDYYVWTVKKTIGDDFTAKYNALAFILIDGGVVFLDEVSLSAKDIATRIIPNTNNEDPALPALEWMRDH